MREILTIIAACLVAALTAALAVPPFVDWDAQSGWMAAHLSAALGGDASVGRPVSLRLLPAPKLTVGSIAVDRPGLALRSQAATFELSPTALLRGRFEFSQVALDHADIALSPADFAPGAAQRARVRVERLTLTEARLHIGGARPLAFDHVALTGAADTLAGPFRGAGEWRGERRLDFSFSTGEFEDGKMRAQLALDDSSAGAHADLEGDVVLVHDAPTFSGHATTTGTGEKKGEAPWRATCDLTAAPDAVRAENIEARLGDADHALTATGTAEYGRAAPLVAKLAAHNLDLDRFHEAYGVTALAKFEIPIPLSLDLVADSATAGGATVAGPSLNLRVTPGATPQVVIEADPPGRGHLHYAGALQLAHGVELDGAMRISLRDPRTFADWIAPAAPDVARMIALAQFGRVDVNAVVKGSAAAFSARLLDVALDRSRFAGALSWTAPNAGARGMIEAQLTSSALDIDQLPDVSALAALGGDLDVAASLDAQAIKVARVGQSSADAGRIRLRAMRDARGFALDDLSIADLGGATLTGAGRFTQGGGRLDLKLDATRLADLAGLVRQVAPGAASEAFFARARALSPAHLTLGLTTGGAPAFMRLDLAGDAGGTRLSAHLHPVDDSARRVEVSARAEGADAAVMLRQLGLAVIPIKGLGPGVVEAQGAGAPGQPMSASAHFEMVGANIDFAGDADVAPDRVGASGALAFKLTDVAPFIQMLALGAPDLTRRLPVEGKARLALASDTLSLDDLSASIVGVAVRGALVRDVDGKVTGALSLDALSAPFLASLVLGPPQPAAAGALWPQLGFAPTPFDPPTADLDLSVARFDLGGASGADAHMRLALAPNALEFRDLSMRLGGGRLAGEGSLRREGATALGKARLSADGVEIASGPFSARVTGRLDAGGAGASTSQFVGSLAGAGHARFTDVGVARAAPDALARVVIRVDADEIPIERATLTAALSGALDNGEQLIDPFDGDLALAAGRLALTPAAARAGGREVRIGGGLDLRSGALDLRETMNAPPSIDWTGSPPALNIVWSGDFRAPTRTVRADAVIASLAERAIAREAARNAALEADIRERAFFNRRLKFDRQREADRQAELARMEKARLDAKRAEKAQADMGRPDLRREAPVDTARSPANQPLRARAPSAFAPAPRGAAPDPSTAGRY